MKRYYKLLLLSVIVLLNGCSTEMVPRGWKYKEHVEHPLSQHVLKKHIQKRNKKINKIRKKKTYSSNIGSPSYHFFKKTTNLFKSYKVYKNQKLLSQSTKKNTQIKIDISEQRIRMYVNNSVALDAPCTTGSAYKFNINTRAYQDKHTPLGTFKILQKIANKYSSKIEDNGARRKYTKSILLKNWMGITAGGDIALYGSFKIKRYPDTNGCIHLPYGVSNIIFRYVYKGTIVSIHN